MTVHIQTLLFLFSATLQMTLIIHCYLWASIPIRQGTCPQTKVLAAVTNWPFPHSPMFACKK